MDTISADVFLDYIHDEWGWNVSVEARPGVDSQWIVATYAVGMLPGRQVVVSFSMAFYRKGGRFIPYIARRQREAGCGLNVGGVTVTFEDDPEFVTAQHPDWLTVFEDELLKRLVDGEEAA